ncbi:hypothetical protein KEM48_000922 [Puccinia striiformis f. sp. tritici PST-130]|nr:hypothetical protein KEM48_000922 [Puccinia striiformis f. sp. tritici PST-130]
MSDLDDYFDDDIDAAAFDAVVNAATAIPPPPTRQPIVLASSSTIDDCFDDDFDAAAFDAVVNAATSAPPPTRRLFGSGSNNLTQKKYIQPTIFGASQVPAKPSRPNKQNTSSQYQQPVPKATQQAPKTKAVKKWDNTTAIKMLPEIMQNGKKVKKKSKFAGGDNDDDEEMIDDEELDSDTDLLAKALQETNNKKIPMKLQSDSQAIKTWIYSINKPKRKYQYDIVARALYNNCLFYRWYPHGKVLFLAPTRPLVHQQIEACHSIAGIPSVDCVSLTGTTSAAKRAIAWQQKRVIFATPQTVANDLRRGSLRPEDIICVVVDEAHRATGAYAYCVVVKLLMRFNPHFRVLALTATPGSDPERVQAVIDNLHIGHIEVRTEETHFDPRQMGKLMLPVIDKCGFLFHGPKDPAYIHAFSITSAQMNIPKDKGHLRPHLALLAKMAMAMAKLLEYSITLAYEKMLELKEESGKAVVGVCSQVGYKSLMSEIRELTLSPDFVPHPKMEKMKALTLEFFLNAQDQGKSSRVMIFCHFRDMVTDIVDYLNQERPLIKASPFVGQSNDEGLDIGALDFIICYEAQKSPLRMLQRLGRTGRNEDGKVIVLIAEGREDKNWEKAQDQYQHVQNALLSKKVLELYEDCERLVPEGVRPKPVEEMIDVQPYIAEQVELTASPSGRKKKDKPPKDYAVPKSKADALRQRTEAALLTVEEAAVLHQQWSKNITSVPPPIDPKNFKIEYLPTKSQFGSKLEAVPPSKRLHVTSLPLKYSAIMKECALYVFDDAKYEAWRDEKVARMNSENVTWWPTELRGTGAQKPLKLCAGGPNSMSRRWTNFRGVDGSHVPTDPCPNPLATVSNSPRLSSPRLSDEIGWRQISLIDRSKGASKRNPREKLLPPPPIAPPPPVASTSTITSTLQRADSESSRPNKSCGFQRLAAFKSTATEPAPFQATTAAAMRESPQKAPVTPSGPSSNHGLVKKVLIGPAQFQVDDQSPLLFRALTQNKQPPISPSEYENGDHFAEPQMLMMATQMPRNKRAQKAFDPDGNPGKTKRIITLESDDDVVQDYEDDDEVEVQGHADKKSRPTGSDLDSDHHSRQKHRPNKTRSKETSSKRSAKSKGKQRQTKRSTRGDEWALKTGLFDLEASESDTSSSNEKAKEKREKVHERRSEERRERTDVGRVRRMSNRRTQSIEIF